MSLRKDGMYNLKIHYIWTFLSSFLFLTPVITLYYKYYGLNLHQILVLSAIYFIFSVILEIPTSLIWDSLPRRYVLRGSVIATLISLLIYAFFPSLTMFYVAVFFAALGTTLWSGVGHSKLQEDLEAAWMENEFWKVIWYLIGLQNLWKLLTPFIIYLILKNFSNWYHILAIFDVISWLVASFFVFKFKEVKDRNFLEWKTLFESISYQVWILKEAFNFLFTNTDIQKLLLVVVLTTDFWYLWKIILPDLVSSWIRDYITSYLVFFSVLAGIIWNLIQSKIANKIGYEKTFKLVVFLNFMLYAMLFFVYRNKIALVIIFVFISFVVWMWYPVWNHIFMQRTSVQQKSTVRSLFIMILSFFSWIVLLISSYLSLSVMLLMFSLMMFLGLLILNLK